MSFPVTTTPENFGIWGNLTNEGTVFPDPTSNGPPNNAGDCGTWSWRSHSWSTAGWKPGTTRAPGEVDVPAVDREVDAPPPSHPPATSSTLHQPFGDGHAFLLQRLELGVWHSSPPRRTTRRTTRPRATSTQPTSGTSWHRQSVQFQLASQSGHTGLLLPPSDRAWHGVWIPPGE